MPQPIAYSGVKVDSPPAYHKNQPGYQLCYA
jgi:hypothetical protein